VNRIEIHFSNDLHVSPLRIHVSKLCQLVTHKVDYLDLFLVMKASSQLIVFSSGYVSTRVDDASYEL